MNSSTLESSPALVRERAAGEVSNTVGDSQSASDIRWHEDGQRGMLEASVLVATAVHAQPIRTVNNSTACKSGPCNHRECAQGLDERFMTWATAITAARTIVTLVLGVAGAREHSLTLLISALVAYWIGDIADGFVARLTRCETRIGATLDIMCDRISAAVFYIGFAWFDPSMTVPVALYLLEFMVVDMYLSLAFLAWPVSSPNYFHLINERLWKWNWSKPGKAINSALFAVVMVWTRDAVLVGVIASILLTLKITSFAWLLKLQMPVPAGCVHPNARAV